MWFESDYYVCYNAADDGMDDKISSLNTHDMRIVLFENRDCEGKNFITGPGEGICEDHLEYCKFNNIISSYMLVPKV